MNKKEMVRHHMNALENIFTAGRNTAISQDKTTIYFEKELFVSKTNDFLAFIVSLRIVPEKEVIYVDFLIGSFMNAFYDSVNQLCSKLSSNFSPYTFFTNNNKVIARYAYNLIGDVIDHEKVDDIIRHFERILKKSYPCIRKVSNGILPNILDLLSLDTVLKNDNKDDAYTRENYCSDNYEPEDANDEDDNYIHIVSEDENEYF